MEIEKTIFGGDILDAPIGQDKPTLEPKTVLIVGLKIDSVKMNTKETTDKLTLICKHPDSDEPINISSIKFLDNLKIKQSGLWIKRDKEGKIPPKAAIAYLLRFKNKPTVNNLVGQEVDTILDDAGYLCVKAF